jgi:hypothetical protein
MKTILPLIVLLCGCEPLIDRIPPRDLTFTAMAETKVRMEMYLQKNERLPPDFKSLPVRENHANRTDDAWHRPLIYTIESGNTVVLKSLGADGKPGGTGDDEDLTAVYKVENGHLEEISISRP